MLSKIQEFLLLDKSGRDGKDQLRLSRSSALRIICLCGLLLVLGVAVHSSYKAAMVGRYEVPFINFFFYSLLLVQAWLATRYYPRHYSGGRLVYAAVCSLCRVG